MDAVDPSHGFSQLTGWSLPTSATVLKNTNSCGGFQNDGDSSTLKGHPLLPDDCTRHISGCPLMRTTKEWALSHGLCVADNVPPVDNYSEPHRRTSSEVAARTIVLHCVAAVGYGVDQQPIIDWLKSQLLWDAVSPIERNFLCSENLSDDDRNKARWRQESQWALLWAIGKVAALGLPTKACDTRQLIDEIMPALGDPVDSFVSSAKLRSPAQVLGEDDRVYQLHCYARRSFRDGTTPDDLVYDVLFQRHYAFEWLSGDDDWDDVTTDT